MTQTLKNILVNKPIIIIQFCGFFFFQFTIYSSYYATIAFVFSLRGLFVIWREKKKVSNHDINPAVTS